jgi:LysM repeat protein
MLLSPVMNSKFRYQNSQPQVRFQWTQRPGASYYILEVCDAPDFENLQIDKQLAASSYVQSELGSGTWYWRVRPVFPSAYEGEADYSVYSVFVIEKTDDPQAIAIEVPEPSEIVRPLVSSIPVTSAIHEHVQAASVAVQSGASAGIEHVSGAIESLASHAGSAAAVVSRRIRSAVSHLPGSGAHTTAAAADSAGTGSAHGRKIHIVQIGETLSRIAHHHYGSYQLFTKIIEANNIENPDLIYPDQELHIP